MPYSHFGEETVRTRRENTFKLIQPVTTDLQATVKVFRPVVVTVTAGCSGGG